MVWLQHQSSFSSNKTELHNFHLAANTPRLVPGLILIILQSATLVNMLQSFLDMVVTRDMPQDGRTYAPTMAGTYLRNMAPSPSMP